jgi:ribulose-phosphate 3-epimerase
MRISLSLWSLDQARMATEVQRYQPVVDSFHVDVMDGHFADDLLFGPLTVRTLRQLTTRPIVAHLMVTEPGRWVSRFVDAGADVLVVHPSSTADLPATLHAILDAGAGAGLGIGRHECAAAAIEHLPDLSTVLVMGTEIGVKGHDFDDAALDTVAALIARRAPAPGPDVMVDGGIRWSSVTKIAAAGADGVVAGSLLAAATDPAAAAATVAKL